MWWSISHPADFKANLRNPRGDSGLQWKSSIDPVHWFRRIFRYGDTGANERGSEVDETNQRVRETLLLTLR